MDCKNEFWDAFDSHFCTIIDDICETNDNSSEISRSYNRIKEVLEYNVPFGKRTRGLTVVSSFNSLKNGKATTEEESIAMTLGWCVEMLQASMLIADDLMDQSETRRGQLCWYRKEDVGNQAVNDSMLIESCIFVLLRKYCRHLPNYTDFVELFHEMFLDTEMGQSLDMLTSGKPEVDFSLFTEERYFAIVKYKTVFYTFYLPVAAALYLAGISDPKVHAKASLILTKMGNLFQVQDDYLDVFGDPQLTGKIGKDIEDNKCSWFIVKAIAAGTPDQLKTLKENYGQNDLEKVKIVKQIYRDLDLPGVFTKYEFHTYEEICADIEKFDEPTVPKSIFLNLLNKIYKRNK